jgi:transposase-like protein
VKLNGEMVYLWRAVDHEDEILESYITRTRDKEAALRFMKKTLKGSVRANAPIVRRAGVGRLACPAPASPPARFATSTRHPR